MRLSPDETIAYYSRHFESNGYDIGRALRGSRSEPFVADVTFQTNDAGWDISPTVTGDGMMLYFESQRGSTAGWRIFQSSWDAERNTFVSVDLAPGLGNSNATHSDGGPYVIPSGDVLYFHTNRFIRPVIARAERVLTSFTRVEEVVVTLPTGMIATTAFPVVSADELTLYFVVAEDKQPGDIWRATRTNRLGLFGEPEPVPNVNKPNIIDVPSFISEDGCRLYFDRTTSAWNDTGGLAHVAEAQPDVE